MFQANMLIAALSLIPMAYKRREKRMCLTKDV